MENKNNPLLNRGLRWCGVHKDAIAGAVVFIFGLAMFIAAKNIKPLLMTQTITSGFFPRVLGSGLMITSLILIAGDIWKKKNTSNEKVSVLHVESLDEAQELVGINADKKEDGVQAKEEKSIKELWISIVLLSFYLVALRDIGFVITTTIFVTCEALVLTPKDMRKKYLLRWLIIAVVFAGGVYYLFRYILNLFLPVGILG